MMFVMVTGDQLVLDVRRITIYRIIFLMFTTPGMIIYHFQPPYLQYWQIPCYSLSHLVMGAIFCTFNTTFRSLFTASTLLNNCFKVGNSRNFSYETLHGVLAASILTFLWFIYFPWKVILFKFVFSHFHLLRNGFKWRIIANYLGKCKMYRVWPEVAKTTS
jgi:hypothetical protein